MNEMRTYQTRLDLSSEQAALLDAYAALYGKAERSLFARLSAGESLSVLKREFIGGLGITARQFNALAAGVRGKIASVKEVRDRLIEFAKRRIKRAEDVLAEIPDKWKRHQKRRRIATLQARLANLERERDAGKMGICFGSRKLFREQFALAKNDLASHEEWLAEWRQARSSQFFAMGSRDETAGCQSCVAAVQDDGSVRLRLRLPDALGAGKHLAIARVRFALRARCHRGRDRPESLGRQGRVAGDLVSLRSGCQGLASVRVDRDPGSCRDLPSPGRSNGCGHQRRSPGGDRDGPVRESGWKLGDPLRHLRAHERAESRHRRGCREASRRDRG